ncbi:hypothetical protein B4U79_01836 [Dinothrombium tinctorium]|uniref:Replication termination factor 2 n=1 Tax=Dinothrombium tinctorium TaxID=1965070 RepID=A0A443RKM3_9ACAR|nr:hypothetical protein B4U79_01836 [Dinothrombium tinctorium]
MGCDGGTIPKRDELVKTRKKAEEKDKSADTIAKWKYCALSSTPLREPIVACELGLLYNKEAVIQYLLDKDSYSNKVCAHIRGLRDVITLNLTKKANYKEKSAEKGGEYVDVQDSEYICPVVGLEMNGKYKFYFFRKCGCVISERALKEVKSDVCHKCGVEVDMEDVIVINGGEEEVNSLRMKMEERRAKEKMEKKLKKRKAEEPVNDESKKELKMDDTKSVSKQKVATNKTPAPAAKASIAALPEKARSDYSVAKDPTNSEAYKSIFTSHESAKNRPKSHWVTYNPLYF